MPRPMIYDRWLFLTVLLLVIGGLFMVGSASTHFAMDHGKSPSALWLKHAFHLLAGIVGLITMLKLPYARLADGRLLLVLFLACLVGLLLVLGMPSAGGARRWIFVGSLAFQPSEFAKLFVVLFCAWLLSRKEDEIGDDKTSEVVVYCQVGERAALAEDILAGAGYTNVRDLEGHMKAWRRARYPIQ